jgi:RHS repeat-associated protein
MSPQVGDSGMFRGDDGLGGYMPLAVAVPTATAGITQLSWVHANHMGVPIRYSDASGNMVNPTGDYSVPGFPGQSQTTTDLYYNKYRDYDPTTGRYIQADPIGLAGGASPYSYAMNNPLRYGDPQGEFVPLVLCGIGGLAGGAGTYFGEAFADKSFNWKHVAIGAGAGCVAGVAAPFVATSAAGAALLGAGTNAAQYAATQYIDGDCITWDGLAINAGLGAIGGRLAGPFKPNGMQHSTDVLPWMRAGTRDVHRSLNEQEVVNAAKRGLVGSAVYGAGTTASGEPGFWSRIKNALDWVF